MQGSDASQEQNVLFRDQNPSYMYGVDYVDDPTRALQDTDDATLDNFFSRPVKISSVEWGTGNILAADFDPWEQYFNNPRVINRLTNYNLMRAKLHVKIVINGNGFQYGRALAAYLPMDSYDQMTTITIVPQDLVQLSQLPHIYLDPTTSSGGEMCLPFFAHENSAVIPSAQYRNLGRLYLRSMNELKHANGAGDVCTVNVFAWAEDVQLNVLTSSDASTLVPQMGYESNGKSKKTMQKSSKGGKKSNYAKQDSKSGGAGKEIDEANATGIVSGPATTVMKVANALTFVPQIAPFAMATSKVAGTVANVAKALGYSRPPVTKNPDPFRPTPTSQLATTNTPDTAIKLTIDEKQELTIDPAIAGLGPEDPLCIQNIASRESYLTKFAWPIAGPPELLLYNLRVDPVLWDTSGAGTAFHFPATAMAALPFEYWTGTIKFRFQIVASAFHKGRLKFVYDPQFLDTNEYNTNYTEIVDIAETQDFTIEVGNGQETTLLKHAKPGIDAVGDMHNIVPLSDQQYGNGVLGVYVVNELTTPNSTVDNDVQINVFVSAGDDFEVFVPDNHFQHFVMKPQMGYEPQSGAEIVPDAQGTEEPSAPEQSTSSIVGPGIQDTAQVNKVFTGEAIMSFRPLLKRYNLWRREKTIDGTTAGMYRIEATKSIFPLYRGAVNNAVDTTGALAAYNYCNTVLLHWVAAAFSGWRGSIRYKLMFDRMNRGNTIDHKASRIYVSRGNIKPFGTPSYTRTITAYAGNATDAAASSEVILGNSNATGHNGMLFATDAVNNTVEFEAPYYSQYRFTPGKQLAYSGTAFNWTPTWDMDATVYGTDQTSVDYHVAAGEDFQVYFFTGLPRLYYEATPPAP